MNPPRRTGLRSFARFHNMNVQELIGLLGLLIRWHAHLSEKTGSLAKALATIRQKRRASARLFSAGRELDGDGRGVERTGVALDGIEEEEARLEGEQREAERLRETYDKAVGAVLRVLDVRRSELTIGGRYFEGQ